MTVQNPHSASAAISQQQTLTHPYKHDQITITSKKLNKKKAVSIDFGSNFLAKQRKMRNNQQFVSYQTQGNVE